MKDEVKKHVFGQVSGWIATGTLQDIIYRVIISLVIIVIFYALRTVFLRLVLKKTVEVKARRKWKRNSTYIWLVFLGMILFPVWLPSLQNMLAVIGIFGAGALVSLKEVIQNVAGWVYIQLRRPFEEGNRVAIAGFMGDVIDIRLFEFSIIEVKPREEGGLSTGRVLHIPNSLVFTQTLANSSKEFSFNWNELKIPLTTDSNWKRAVTLVEKIANTALDEISKQDSRIQHSEEEYSIRYAKLTPGVFVEFQNGHILITLRHLVEPRKTRQISDLLWRAILTQFAKEKAIHMYSP